MSIIETTSKGIPMEIVISHGGKKGKTAIVTCPPGGVFQGCTEELVVLAALDSESFLSNGRRFSSKGLERLAVASHKKIGTIKNQLQKLKNRYEERNGSWVSPLAIQQEAEKLGLLDEATIKKIRRVTKKEKITDRRTHFSE